MGIAKKKIKFIIKLYDFVSWNLMSSVSLNRVFILGNLTRTPELRQLPSDQVVCKFGLATSSFFKSKTGENSGQEVCFVDVNVWGAQAAVCKKVLDKGSTVLVEGRLRFESWSDQTGAKRSRHSIIADRVTFIRTNSQFQTGSNTEEDALFDKGEIDLENEEAFKEELPF